MFFRSPAHPAQEFHVLVMSGVNVIRDEIVRCAHETSAFERAEEIVSGAANNEAESLVGYVLNQDQVFIGTVRADCRERQEAA